MLPLFNADIITWLFLKPLEDQEQIKTQPDKKNSLILNLRTPSVQYDCLMMTFMCELRNVKIEAKKPVKYMLQFLS